MGLETATYIHDLVTTNPIGASDTKAQGDDHLRLIKTTLKNTLPGLAGRIGRVIAKSAAYTVLVTENTAIFNCTAAPWTLTLPTVASAGNGFYFFVFNNGSDTITLDGDAAEQINGVATVAVPQNCFATVFCNGSAWLALISKSTSATTTEIQSAAKAIAIGAGWLCPFKNLVSDWASNSTENISANALVLAKSTGETKLFSSLNLSGATPLDITLADQARGRVGVGGAAAAAEAASTWYHRWAIGKEDGTISAVYSVADPSAGQTPSLPAGYDYFGYIGAVYNNSSSNLYPTSQRDAQVSIDLLVLVSSGTATSPTSFASALATAIPTTARVFVGRMDAINFLGGANGDPVSIIYASSTTAKPAAHVGQANVNSSSTVVGYVRAPILTPQSLWYENANGSDYRTSIWASGWEF